MKLFVLHENIRATLHRQNLRLTAVSPETAFRLRRLLPISINASARSNSSLSGAFQESVQRSVRNEQPTCGNFVATQTAVSIFHVGDIVVADRENRQQRRAIFSRKYRHYAIHTKPQTLTLI
jgi:hypothetical protein